MYPAISNKRTSNVHRYGVDYIVVQVGSENKKDFAVHKGLLIRHSDFFQAALTGDWKEKKDGAVPLPEQDPEIFKTFQHFLYSGQVCTSRDGDYHLNDDGSSRDKEWVRLAEAWVLGDAILSTSFKDAVVDAIIAKVINISYSPTNLHTLVYPKSTVGAKIRTLLVDLAVWRWNRTFVPSPPPGDSALFFYDAFLAINKIKDNEREGKPPFKGESTCNYHEHGDDEPCYKTFF